MKFAYKITAAILLLLAAVLSVGGYWMIYSDFSARLAQLEKQNTASHMRDKYLLETALLQFEESENTSQSFYLNQYGSDLVSYTNSSADTFAIYTVPVIQSATAVFSNIPLSIGKTKQIDAIERGEKTLRILKAEDKSYMLIASQAAGSEYLWLLSCYDITELFLQRDAQLSRFLQLEAVALIVSAGAAFLLAVFITRPLKKLEAASKSIANGAYNEKSNIRSNDEIGELSKSFDIMANSISNQISLLNLSLAQRDDFVAAFTHEIKTPMTAILGYSDILRSGKYSEIEIKSAADYIYHESKRLESLSQKLLSLMQLSSDDITLVRTNLTTVITMLLQSLTPKQKSLVTVECESFNVLCDAVLLTDLLRNLVINALKAVDYNKLVLLKAEKEGSAVKISVSDNGCGISKEDLPHITQPFYMADKSRARKQNGSGMGLALSQKIAAVHNTSLNFKSEAGEGTTVNFILHLAETEAVI